MDIWLLANFEDTNLLLLLEANVPRDLLEKIENFIPRIL
jgi:hypothetical protein